MKVAIPQDITQPGKEYLTQRGYELVIGSGDASPEAIKALIADSDGILARTAHFTSEILSGAPKLKVIGRHGIGVDNIDVPWCTARGIYVTFAPNSNAVSVAEHTIGCMIAAAHHFSRFDRQVRQGQWEMRNQFKGVDLQGKTLGLVGLGRIGTQVAKKAIAAFEMKVVAYDAFLAPELFPQGVQRAACPQDVYAAADFLSLHTPATPQTTGMINKTALALMRPTAFLINCSRGEVVNSADLYDALKNNLIRGAAIDVFETEPPQPGEPLFTLDNVLLTPHSAALTQESMDRMGLHAAMGIDAVLSGQKPQWPVNRPTL